MKRMVPQLKSLTIGSDTLDLNYLLNAVFEDIGEAAESIPAAIGWLGYQRALAVQRLILSEQTWKKVEAQEYFDLKNGEYVSRGFGEKLTEEALKKAVVLADKVTEACEDYAKCKKNVDWMSTSIEALQAKLELVRSSEATRRMEHEPDKNKRTIV